MDPAWRDHLEALKLDIAAFLDERGLPYMVIGGFANLYWPSESGSSG